MILSWLWLLDNFFPMWTKSCKSSCICAPSAVKLTCGGVHFIHRVYMARKQNSKLKRVDKLKSLWVQNRCCVFEWVKNKMIYANPQSPLENKSNFMVTFRVSEWGISLVMNDVRSGIWPGIWIIIKALQWTLLLSPYIKIDLLKEKQYYSKDRFCKLQTTKPCTFK